MKGSVFALRVGRSHRIPVSRLGLVARLGHDGDATPAGPPREITETLNL
jgi:hypothetical protein